MNRLDLRFDAEKTAKRANIAGLQTAAQPDGTYPVDVPVWVSYKRTAVQAFATLRRPPGHAPTAQRDGAHHDLDG